MQSILALPWRLKRQKHHAHMSCSASTGSPYALCARSWEVSTIPGSAVQKETARTSASQLHHVRVQVAESGELQQCALPDAAIEVRMQLNLWQALAEVHECGTGLRVHAPCPGLSSRMTKSS